MTFEQEEPGAGEAKSGDPAQEPDHDAWLKRWLSKGKSKPANSDGHKGAKTEKSVSDAARVSENDADGESSRPGPTKDFADAVDSFRKQTPVLLEKPAPEPEDETLEELEAKPTVGARIKRFFLSDRLTAVLGVTGELLITGGAFVLLFLAWQLWINNAIVAGQQAEAVKEFSNSLTASPTPSSSSAWTPKPGAIDYGPPPVLAAVGQNAVMGNLYVPRLGSGSTRAVANGVSDPSATYNRGYYGKYEETQWPGEPGNFAMAVHRTGWGTSFTQAQTIRPGDKMYLETPQGWYIYTVRNTEYILPTQVNVLNPMPLTNAPAVAGQSIMTITTCSPIDGNGERLVVYAILSSWQPLEADIPAEITKLVAEVRS